MPAGVGRYSVSSRHEFPPQGRFDGTRYHQTFQQQARIVETRTYAYANTHHVCGGERIRYSERRARWG